MNVLAIGAHPDDIELGCAGALARHRDSGHRVFMLVMTMGERGQLNGESRVEEQERAAKLLGADLIWAGFDDGAIPNGPETVSVIDAVLSRHDIDVVYTHSPNDSHQDHVATARASMAAGRRTQRVLCYQAPSTTSFDPNVFVDITESLDLKIDALLEHRSQVLGCEMIELDAIRAGARYWGQRARVVHAEAFESPRFVWDPAGVASRAPRLTVATSLRSTNEYAGVPVSVHAPAAGL